MFKKIEVFITLFILSCTIIFKTYVFASAPVIDYSLLMDAVSTLYFMTGLKMPDGINSFTTDKDKYDWIDSEIRAEFDKANAQKAQELHESFDEFIQSVKTGYGRAFHLNDDLYQYMQDLAYSNAIAPSTINKNAPTYLQTWLASQSGNIVMINNEYRSSTSTNSPVEYWNVGSVTPLSSPYLQSKTISQGSTATTPAIWYYTWRLTPESTGYPIMYHAYTDRGELRVDRVDWLHYAMAHTDDADGSGDLDFAIIMNHTSSYAFSTDALINDYISKGQYTDIIDNVYGVDTDGNVIIDSTGELPNTIGRDTTSDYINDITDGQTTWGQIIGSYADSEPAVPSIPADGALTLPQLDNLITDLHLERLNTKFPFCIPSDIKLIFDGATTVSGNAPVIHIPIHLEFRNHVFYDDSDGIVIDFNTFQPVVVIFREGFFLLFLLGLVWATIEVMQAFFIATE